MKLVVHLMSALALTLVVSTAAAAEDPDEGATKGCPPGDKIWDPQAFILKINETTVEMTGRTRLTHYEDHPGCSGNVGVRLALRGVAPIGAPAGWGFIACESALATGNHEQVFSERKRCFNLGKGGYYTQGTHYFDGKAADFTFSSSEHLEGPEPPPPPEDPWCDQGTQCYCESNGGEWDDEFDHCVWMNCPLLVDLRSNTGDYGLTSADNGVEFDMFGRGVRTRMGWTAQGSDVAFIARDLNGNGLIDNGTELFGNGTRRSDGSHFSNGFEALAALDSNGDGRVGPRDRAFSELQLWIDRNHNGISEPDELTWLASAGVEVLFTVSQPDHRVDQNGNIYFAVGVTLIDRGRGLVPRRIFDVIFVQ